MFILSIGSAAIFYSAWFMNLPVFSSGWFMYCAAWIPLLMIFMSADKYDRENTQELSKQKTTQKLHRAVQNNIKY